MIESYYKKCKKKFIEKFEPDFLLKSKNLMDTYSIYDSINITDIGNIFNIYFGDRYNIKETSYRPKISKHLKLSPLHNIFNWNKDGTNKTKRIPTMASIDDAFVLTKNIIISINLAYKDAMELDEYIICSEFLTNHINNINGIFIN